MKVRKVSDGRSLDVLISSLLEERLSDLVSETSYVFDWSLERYNEVFELRLLSDLNTSLGIVSIVDERTYLLINIDLIEVARPNRGRQKKIEDIAGCLLAFVCLLSFERGYDGYVTLDPKSFLRDHYKRKYGFEDLNYQLISTTANSRQLINQFLRTDASDQSETGETAIQ